MKKYIIIVLILLTSCTQKIGADFDLIENSTDSEKSQLVEKNLSVDHSIDFRKNKEFQKSRIV